jgi:amino acid permease
MDSEKIQQDDTFTTVQHAESCSIESTSVNEPYHLKRSLKARHIQVSNTLSGQNAESNHTMILT